MLFWLKILERKYSFQFTFGCTFLRCLLGCILKIYLYRDTGVYGIYVTTVMNIVTFLIYLAVLFKATLGKKVLSFTIANIMFIFTLPKRWLKLAFRAESIEQFQKEM